MKNLQSREEFLNESIDQRVRAAIVAQLKSEGLIFGEDYDYKIGTFYANDMETAQAMADAVAGKFRCMIYDDKITKDGKVPMMIVK
jgi:hypothetical protein